MSAQTGRIAIRRAMATVRFDKYAGLQTAQKTGPTHWMFVIPSPDHRVSDGLASPLRRVSPVRVNHGIDISLSMAGDVTRRGRQAHTRKGTSQSSLLHRARTHGKAGICLKSCDSAVDRIRREWLS